VENGEVVEECDHYLKPFPEDQIEDGALRCNGLTRETIAGFPPAQAVLADIISRLERHRPRGGRFFMVGYNVGFDDGFLRALWKKCGRQDYTSWFWWPLIDVMALAGFRLIGERPSLQNFKLETVARFLGIEPPQGLHNAAVDIMLTRQVMRKLYPALEAGRKE
jgi:DNA polymerase-3 subunit epsilon